LNKKIFLINAGNDPSMSSIANDYSFPPLGILALGTWIQDKIPSVEVICRDTGICGVDEVLKEIELTKPFLVGISVLATSYQTALKIAKFSKLNNSYVVFGNDQASHLSKNILLNRSYIDFVIGAEYGEYALELLINALSKKTSFENIPTLTYRDKEGKIQGFDFKTDKEILSILNIPHNKSKKRVGSLDIFPIIDRTLYPQYMWDKYLENYLLSFSHLHKKNELPKAITTMNRARGCSRANENIKCKHCDMLLDISFSSEDIFWEEVKQANRDINAELFYEVCDSLTSFSSFLRKIEVSKPKNLGFNPKFFIYGQALDIVRNPKLLNTLKNIGVFKINIGLESGCDITLKDMKGSYDSVKNNYFALKELKKKNIFVYGSFVLGTELETRETMMETIIWIKKIIDEELISDVEIQPILPLPNNVYGKRMFDNNSVNNSDWPIDIDEISKKYINTYSGVSYDEVISAINIIREYTQKKHLNFGSGVSKKENYKEN